MCDAPAWLPCSIVVIVAIGFVPALVFAWVYETADISVMILVGGAVGSKAEVRLEGRVGSART